ncbi:hypothetical protein KFK09_025067 [Dendrobium nobile]|uniref:Uncharacterized protein n=1 Tax=Dendrobium nobile TaxID=94219 RepID=A0A8T3AFV1_DENNO|nr:hypothetical protein KFK09_025067 [Dendrobium nobile]
MVFKSMITCFPHLAFLTTLVEFANIKMHYVLTNSSLMLGLRGGVQTRVATSVPSWLFDFAPSASLIRRRCTDCARRYFGSFVAVRLRSFDDFPFLSDRKLRHFDRKQEQELAGCEGRTEQLSLLQFLTNSLPSAVVSLVVDPATIRKPLVQPNSRFHQQVFSWYQSAKEPHSSSLSCLSAKLGVTTELHPLGINGGFYSSVSTEILNVKYQADRYLTGASAKPAETSADYKLWKLIDQNLISALYSTVSPSILPYILNSLSA